MAESNTSNSAASTFIIRIWREWSLTESRWYGRIEQLHTNQTLTFREFSQLLNFLATCGFTNEEIQSAPVEFEEVEQI